MAVKITEDMYDTFTNNGYTQDDIQNTVSHYRDQGMPDSAIFTALNKKHRELAGIKDVSTPQIGDQPNYDAILNNPALTPQQQAEQIKQKGEAYRAGLDKDLAAQKAKMYTGAAIKIASPLVGLGLAPFTGGMSLPASMAVTGLAEGATFGLGEALQNQKTGADFAKDVATQGLLGGLMGAGTGALFKGASKVLPKVFNRPVNVPKDVQELGELATNPQAYVAKTGRPVGVSRLPKEIVPLAEAPTVGEAPIQQVTPNKFAIEADTDIVQPAQTVEQPNVGAIEQPAPEMVQPQPQVKQLPPLNDNYLKDLSQYTPTLHREMSPAQAMKFIGNISTNMTPEQLYFSNKPELALGQGANKGILVELDSKGIQGQVNTNKPIWESQYQQGNAEFISKLTPQSVYRQNVKSITIKPDAKFTTIERRVIKNSLKDWTKVVNEDGSITFIKPQVNVPEMVQPTTPQPTASASEMVRPLNKQALQKDLNVELRALRNSIELPEVTNGEYVKGRYKNRFYQKDITDDMTRDIIDADKSLLEVTKEIKNNPANALQNMDILENKLTDKVGKLPDEAQQKYYDKFYKDLDIANTHEELRKKALTPEGAGFVADDVINSKQKVTKLSQSILKAKGLPTDIKKTIKQNAPTYESMTNNDLIMTASDAIDKDLMGNLADIMAKDKFNAFDVERTRQIAKRLNAQNTPESNETLVNLLDKASEQASKSGQAVQAFSLWNNLTPEGAILKTNKLLNEYNKRFGKNLKLTQEQINNITKLQETAQALPAGYDKDVALAKSLKYQQSIIPKSLGSKIKAYRNISLLLNPKTLGRNVVGNALFNTIDTASKTLAVPIDKAMGAFTKTHTRALPQVGESLKGLKLGAERGFKEAMQGINTADVSSRYDLRGGKVFESKVGQAFETALDLGLRVPDRAFYNSVYAESLANQLKASGLKEPTQKMLDTAEQEALEGVFQNKSKLSDIALGLRKQFNRVGTKEFGLGDLLIPYAQTPSNLAQQGINYSPLGLLRAGASLKGGNERQASLEIARALLGTGIGDAGYGAVKAGQAH